MHGHSLCSMFMMHIDLCTYAFYLHLCISELVSVKIISIDACCDEFDFSILADHDCSVHFFSGVV